MEAVPATDLETLLAETDWLARLALSLTGDPQRAEDLAQETWLAALRRPPARAAAVRPWLATVARNAARFDRRSSGARREREAARAREERDDLAPAPEELLARAESQEALSRLVRELPPELSEVLLLTFHEGRSSAWIARQRGIPAATVRARKQRGLEVLRERLDARHDGDRHAWLSALAPLAASASRRAVGAAGKGGFLAGLLAPWFAMSLPLKVTSLVAALFLALLPFLERGAPAAPPPAPAPAGEELASVPDDVPDSAPPSVATSAATERAPAAIVATASDEPPVTRVRLRVVDPLGRPVADATVRPSLSFAMQQAHAFLEEELGPVRMLTLQAEMTRRTGPDGLASWETDLLREAGLVDFEVVGPRFETGTLRAGLEPGMDEDLGEVVLAPAGAVSGRLRTKSGEDPGHFLVELGPVELPTDAGALESLRANGPAEPVGFERTDARGRFRLTGIPAGEYRAYAHRPGRSLSTWSEPLVVTTGLATGGVEIVVDPDQDLAAEILVLGADGAPLSSAYVMVEQGGLRYGGSVRADGCYLIPSPYAHLAGGRATISDRSFEHHDTVIDPLPLEAGRVVAQLERAETELRTLRLRGVDGASLAAAQVGVTAQPGTRWWSEVEGSVELTLPGASRGAFDLTVQARGFAALHLEGLVASALPDDWTLELELLPGIDGVVLSGGAPVERARVELHELVEAGHVLLEGTEVGRMRSEVLDQARTREDGRFRLHHDSDGGVAVVVTRPGHADAVALLPDYRAQAGCPELVVELDAGGVVRGTVVDHAGAPVQGANVVLDHPMHALRSTRTKGDGSFRFRRVPRGDWYLRVVEHVDDGFLTMRSEVPEGWEFPANCAVAAGQEVVRELTLPDPEGTRVAGRVRCSGADPGALTLHVDTSDGGTFRSEPFAEEWGAQRALDADGSYELRLRAERDYVLRLTAPDLGAQLRREVTAEELPAWDELQLDLVRLRFTRAGALPAAPSDRRVMVSWRGSGWTFDAWLDAAEDGAPAPILVPAGELELAWKDAGGESRTSRVRVARGEELQVELD